MLDCTMAVVQPLPSNRSPSALSNVILMCRPPNMITNESSPYVSGHVHWMSLASLNNGWSHAMIGGCPGFKTVTALRTTSLAWRNIETDFDSSGNSGRSALTAVGLWFRVSVVSVLMAWYAAQDTWRSGTGLPSFSLSTVLLIWSHHLYSSAIACAMRVQSDLARPSTWEMGDSSLIVGTIGTRV